MAKYIIQEAAYWSVPENVKKTPLGTIRFEAILQEAERPNKNRRIYPKRVLEKALENPSFTRMMNTKNLWGEANHPLDTSVARQTYIDQLRSTFLIEKVWWEGNYIKALCETLNTQAGRDMAGVIEQGVQVGFSLRAQGSVHPDRMSGYSVVDDNLIPITFDWVLNPSNEAAYVQNISESTMNMMFGQPALCLQEAEQYTSLCESGNLIEIEDNAPEVKPIHESYVEGYYKKVRLGKEVYKYDENDALLTESISPDFRTVNLQNGNVTKTVVLEDYLKKDLRANIKALDESCEAPSTSTRQLISRKYKKGE